MRMRTLIVVLVLIVLIGTVAYGWRMIRRGFSARDNQYLGRMRNLLTVFSWEVYRQRRIERR